KHVCQDQTQVSIPKLCVDSFAQPQYTPYMTVCDGMRLCSSYKTTYKTSYRQVYKMEASTRTSYICCPGWTQRHKRAKGCLQPVCSKPCVHGRCIRPDTCECRRGWSGDVCDTDENECDADAHGCEQECVNSKGSFICTCRAGYRLNSDGKTCAATGEVIDAKYEALMLRVEELEQRRHFKETIWRLSTWRTSRIGGRENNEPGSVSSSKSKMATSDEESRHESRKAERTPRVNPS
ncbi:negative regulation of Notch signaling pathway, partial [Branchiostoma belcheri]